MSDFSEAISKIKSLEAEVERLVGASEYILEHIRPLKESRNELLEALKQYPEGELERVYIGIKFVHVSKIIERAEALSEKEST